ncbi:MAG: hypothetical protein HY314_10480 [Acidobacteria bacterium]|nr:hypothetical protein [Acidobacteriota bacterium]
MADRLDRGLEAIWGRPPTGNYDRATVGPSAAIYVTGGIGNVVYRFTR